MHISCTITLTSKYATECQKWFRERWGQRCKLQISNTTVISLGKNQKPKWGWIIPSTDTHKASWAISRPYLVSGSGCHHGCVLVPQCQNGGTMIDHEKDQLPPPAPPLWFCPHAGTSSSTVWTYLCLSILCHAHSQNPLWKFEAHFCSQDWLTGVFQINRSIPFFGEPAHHHISAHQMIL